MPWYFPWSESIKKRACRYLLQHYLGDFLKEKLDLDQLTVDLYNGKGTVKNVLLDVWALNEMLANAGVPLDLVDGFIASISVSVPWKALLNDSCELEIHGLNLTFAPKQNVNEGNIVDSTYSWNSMSMTTSIQLAQECLRQESSTDYNESAQTFEGLEAFAQTIESVLARVRLSFVDTNVRFENIPLDAMTGVGVELHVDRIDYWDLSHDEISNENVPQHSVYEPVAVAIKSFKIHNVAVFMEEFPKHRRTRLRQEFSNNDHEENGGEGLYSFTMRKQSSESELPDLLPKVKVLASCGKQDVKIRLKQNDALPGPKVDIDYSMGAINVFLSPRQLHLLVDAVSSIPHSTDACHSEQQKAKTRAMKSEDYMKVEETLLHQFNTIETRPRKNTFESLRMPSQDSIDEDFFSMAEFPLPALGQPGVSDGLKQESGLLHNTSDIFGVSQNFPPSRLSNISLGGSTTSSGTKGTLTERASSVFRAASTSSLNSPKYPTFHSPPNIGLAGAGALDDTLDITHFKLRSSNVIFFLLYLDPVPFHENREYCLREMSMLFFSQVQKYSMQSLFGLDAEKQRDSMLSLCSYDHMRILASASSCEFEKRTMSGTVSTVTDIVIGKLAIDENLYGEVVPEKIRFKLPYAQTKVLYFSQQQKSPLYPGAFGSAQSPCIKAKIQKTMKTLSSGVQSRTNLPPKSSIDVDIGVFTTEIDFSMMDRLISLLYPPPLYKKTLTTQTSNLHMYASLATGRSSNQQTAFHQVIEDSPVTMDHKANITMRCPTATVELKFPIPDLLNDVENKPWWCKNVHKETLEMQVSSVELKTAYSSTQISTTCEIFFQTCNGIFLTSDDLRYHLFDIEYTPEEGDTGAMGVDVPRILFKLSPLSSCSVFDEPDVRSKDSSLDSLEDQFPWMKSEPSPFSTQQNMYENETMVLPACVSEMNSFQEFASVNSKLNINCYFPKMNVNLHDKKTFEIIYNRLLGDLLMWEPSAPSPVDLQAKTSNMMENVHINLASHIGQLESGGDKFFMCKSAIRDDNPNNQSANTSFISGEYNDSPPFQASKTYNQTNICFSLHVDKGAVAMFPPAKCVNDLPSNAGNAHVLLNLCNGHMFLTSGYKGQPNVSFLQISSNMVQLFHTPHVRPETDYTIMSDALSTDGLWSTVHPSEPHVQVKSNSCDNEAMLLLAMKLVLSNDSKRKDNTIALSVCGGTISHQVLQPGQNWFTQVTDFLDVLDFPIKGYTPPTIFNMLHVHLNKSALDYRPLHLPLQSLIVLDSFNISCNVIPGSSVSVLRFFIEDASLYLLHKESENTEYVCLMDMGMFELSLRLTDGADKHLPIVEMAMSNNMLNIHTCSDSCSELIRLIKYFATDGDLQQNVDDSSHEGLDRTLPSPSPVDPMQINSLMADAMIDDTIESHQLNIEKLSEGTLLDTCLEESIDDEDDEELSIDEYCFLDHESDSQVVDHDPVVKKLVEDDIVIIENYFKVPFGKLNQLASPSGYPSPVYKYTVREMSVVWQMYGGVDFKPSARSCSSSTSTSTVTQSFCKFEKSSHSSKSKDGVSQSDKHRTNRVKGGAGRDLNTLIELQLNKIRFQHEVYPEDCQQIYRDVLLIYDLEIRDRLATSPINKFLYRFSSESRPKQSSANMVTVKFLMTKPEDDVRDEVASIRVSLQPLRLNIDQDALFFAKDFLTDISGSSKPSNPSVIHTDLNPRLSSSPTYDVESLESPLPSPSQPTHMPRYASSESVRPAPPLFIKSFVFSPEVPIRFDYHGKHVDIEQGTLTGLIIGLSHLNCSELRLKRLCCRSGLLGTDKLVNYMLTEWLSDIRNNQLSGILGGVGPAYSFLQLFQGLKDLFWLPVQQYRQDGRIVRGLQRGAHSFSTSTAMAFLELSNRLVGAVQGVAELTFDMVSPDLSHSSSLHSKNSLQTVHPAELREGMANAYTVLTEGLSQTASNLVRVATDEHDKKGVTGALGGVLRQIPPTVVKPLILATEATSNVLGGAMNQLAPDKRREALEKWKQNP